MPGREVELANPPPQDRPLSLRTDVGEQEAELVAADSRHGVLTACARPKPVSELVQKRVACVVTECVVDLFEAIEIHQQDGVRRSGALRPLQALRDPVVEERPVREPGERIVQRLVKELRLCILPLDELRQLARDDGEATPPRPTTISPPACA